MAIARSQIIISQFVLFSLFGLTQFIILVRNEGPSFYFWGEWSYVLLSLLAKGVLGSLLIANVLIVRHALYNCAHSRFLYVHSIHMCPFSQYSSFDEAVNAAD